MFMTSRFAGFNDLVGTAISGLDIPNDVYARAVARYRDVSRFVASWLADYSGQIYTQGSIRLGTMVAPIDPSREYDIDLVCQLALLRETLTKKELKALVGRALKAYVATNPDGAPVLRSGKRCWTLEYPNEPFHMDILPAIPNDEAGGTAIWLTDRQLVRWQPSDPIGYANWFRNQMSAEYKALQEHFASRGIEIEDAPPSDAKTNLQLTTQALKRHRDLHFLGQESSGPATIVITTLAARAYVPAETLLEVLADVTSIMPRMIEDRNGVLWVPNPAMEEENFAHRWANEPDRAREFYEWIDAAQSDFSGFQNASDTGSLLESVGRSLGDSAKKHAGADLAQRVNRARTTAIGVSSAGTLTTSPAHAAPSHTFHGDPPTPAHP